jgi:deoxyribodipyrimidine photo-lyase
VQHHRRRFLQESIRDLKGSLKGVGTDLIVLRGDPLKVLKEQVLPLYCDYQCVKLYMSAEYTYEELILEQQVKSLLDKVKVVIVDSSTLVSPKDLPCDIDKLPDVYSQFRTMVEKARKGQTGSNVVRSPLPTPQKLKPLPNVVPESVDTEAVWGTIEAPAVDPRTAFPFGGGETAALSRMKDYFYSFKVKTYKETRNGLVGPDYSTKFSPWLAHGCLSARQIVHTLEQFEERHGGNESTYWVWFELLWRDYFKFVAMKYGTLLFQETGIAQKRVAWNRDNLKFKLWTEGKTGIPFVDANMRELKETGFMSNRGRQNVASFLVKDLRMDWRLGAEWFESYLLDHDPCSNYGNWLYVAGLGNDPREDRYFNMVKQAKDYDPEAQFVLTWCPELKDKVQPFFIQTPWKDPISSYYPPIVMGKGWDQHAGRAPNHSKSKGNRKERVRGAQAKQGLPTWLT